MLAIKITLYRVGRNSPVVEALLSAIENGKQVAVLLELKARFDEESNIEWAKALESAGVHVVYGLVGLKVHSKVALVVRREGETIRRYVHLGTGNYNPTTARLYTDLSFFTADEQIGADVTDLFNYVTGYSAKTDYHKLLVAPDQHAREAGGADPPRDRARLERQRRAADFQDERAGRSGHDPAAVSKLRRRACAWICWCAASAVCAPGIPGVSENIRVTSIVGRFLEHSRIYYFHNGGRDQVYLGSADMMDRNLNHRVELLFPVENKRLLKRLRDDILATYLADNRNARHMQADGTFVWDQSGEPAVNSQAKFLIPPSIAPAEVRKKKIEVVYNRLNFRISFVMEATMKVPEAVLTAMARTNRIFDGDVVATKNMDLLDRVYTANARILPPGAPMISGRDNIKAFWRQAIADMGVTAAKLTTVEAEMAGDGIVEIGRAELTAAPGMLAVKYVVHWKQENGDWKWNVDIWNLNS